MHVPCITIAAASVGSVVDAQVLGAVQGGSAANGMETDDQQASASDRRLYQGSQELGYKRPGMEVSKQGLSAAAD